LLSSIMLLQSNAKETRKLIVNTSMGPNTLQCWSPLILNAIT
jgi:hypothetical protein